MTNRSGNLTSKETQKKISTITKSLSEERKRFIHAHEQEVKRREAELKRLERRQRKYIRLARNGFAMLIVFARSATMRKFFRAGTGSFIFFDHRDNVSISLFREEMQIHFYGGGPVSSEDFMFPYVSPEKFNEWICDSPEKFNEWVYNYEGMSCGLYSFWSEGKVRRNKHDTGTLHPVDMVLSVLIDCANPKKFESYLIDALEENK